MDISSLKDLIILLRSDNYYILFLGIIIIIGFLFYDVRDNKKLTGLSGTGLVVAGVIVLLMLSINWVTGSPTVVVSAPPKAPNIVARIETSIALEPKAVIKQNERVPSALAKKIAISPKTITVLPKQDEPPKSTQPNNSRLKLARIKNPEFDEFYSSGDAWLAQWPRGKGQKAAVEQGKGHVCLKHTGGGVKGPELVFSQRVPVTSTNVFLFSINLAFESYQSDFERLGYPAIDIVFENSAKKQVFGITITPDKYHKNPALKSKVLYRKFSEMVSAREEWQGEVNVNLSAILKRSISNNIASSIRLMEIRFVLDIPEGAHCRKCGMVLNWVKLKSTQNRVGEDVSINIVRNPSSIRCFNSY